MSRDATLGLSDLAELLEVGATPDASSQFDLLRDFVLARWRRIHDNHIRYLAPIYVSSFCVDTCGYCNFSASRKSTPRKRLTVDELLAELEVVMAGGARVIELCTEAIPNARSTNWCGMWLRPGAR